MLKRKPLRLSDAMRASLVIILGIPFKFLKLCQYFIIKNKRGLRMGLEILYFTSYHLLKLRKIEVYNGKIYLNGDTVRKFLGRMKASGASREEAMNAGRSIKDLTTSFRKHESQNQELYELLLTSAYDEEGREIYKKHFA
jgi:hypothetical protein